MRAAGGYGLLSMRPRAAPASLGPSPRRLRLSTSAGSPPHPGPRFADPPEFA